MLVTIGGFALKLSVAQKGLIMAAVPLLLGLIYLAVLGTLLENAQVVAEREYRSRTIVSEANQAQRDLFDAGSAIIAWNYMRNDALRKRLDDAIAVIPERAAKLKALLKDDPSRTERLKAVEAQAQSVVTVLNWHKRQIEESPQDVYHFQFGKFRSQIEGSFKTYVDELHRLTSEERQIQEHLPLNAEGRKQELRLYILAGALLNLLLSLGVVVYFSRDIAARLKILSRNAELFVEHKPLLAPIEGSDEVAELDVAFRKMANDVARAEEMKQAFVAMVSHDLRSPLAAIHGALELVERGLYGEISEKGKKRLSTAQAECDRLLSLVGELLDIEKMEAGMMEMKLVPTDLAELAVQSSNSVKTLAEANAVKIEVFGDHAIVSVDKERIMQVFINLLSNAIKYSPQGATITVNIAMKQDSAHIKIEDQGKGIPRHMLDSVFDRFQQAHGGGAGTSGLGLAICKAIVEAHGGKIGVVSEVGSGSIFWLHLPTSNPAT